MKTEQLIDMLARNVAPAERPRWRRQLAITLVVGLAAAVLLLAVGLGVRADIGAARMPVMLKAMFAAGAAAVMLPLATQLMKPGRPLGWRLGAVGVFVALAAIAACVALIGEDPARRMQAWTGGGFPWCLVLVPVLAAPTAAMLIWMMRAFAPTQLTMTGAAIGGLSGGVGAMAYAMYCPIDSVAFVTTWYVVAIGLCAAIGALIGTRLLRW